MNGIKYIGDTNYHSVQIHVADVCCNDIIQFQSLVINSDID
jgi:hypothetical protein